MDNSFLEIIGEIKDIVRQDEGKSKCSEIGVVSSEFPNITINAYGTQLEKDDLYSNAELIKKDVIKKGDKVLLLPFDEKFIIVCKVVESNG